MPLSSRGQELTQAAFIWLNEGVSVVPAQPKSKAVHLRWREYEKVPPTLNQVRNWFNPGLCNLAVVCGTGGLMVIDFDARSAFDTWQARAGDLARTYTETSGRGYHQFYRVDDPLTRRFGEGVESLGLGHLCIVHPSVHPNGETYKVRGDPLAPIITARSADLFSLLSETFLTKTKKETLSKEKMQPGPIAGNDVVGRIKAALHLLPYALQFTDLLCSGGAGRYWLGRCPFHQDELPSLWVDQEKQIWGCFSPGCKGSKGGDVINFYALANNITVSDAICRLAREVLP